MIDLGLKDSDLKDLFRVLFSNHWIYITVQILDLEHNYISDASHMLRGGQVNVIADAEISRSCTLDLFDPWNSFDFVSDSPADGAMFLDRQVKIVYSIAPPSKAYWYNIPLFCGPIDKVGRDGFHLKVTAQGKESLLEEVSFAGKTLRKNITKTAVIKMALKEMGGEADNKMDIPNKEAKAGKTKFKADAGDEAGGWDVAKKMSISMDDHLFYDGRGVARLRKNPSGEPVFTFRENMIKGDVEVEYDMTIVKNRVIVNGKKAKGGKKKVQGRAVVPKGHALSPEKLGRNGVDRYKTETVSDPSCKTKAACDRRAREILEKRIKEAIIVKFEGLPNPLLEEWDVFAVATAAFTGQGKVKEMSIPLTASGVATMGYVRNTDPKAKNIRPSRTSVAEKQRKQRAKRERR